jgi:hypothetical protein
MPNSLFVILRKLRKSTTLSPHSTPPSSHCTLDTVPSQSTLYPFNPHCTFTHPHCPLSSSLSHFFLLWNSKSILSISSLSTLSILSILTVPSLTVSTLLNPECLSVLSPLLSLSYLFLLLTSTTVLSAPRSPVLSPHCPLTQ